MRGFYHFLVDYGRHGWLEGAFVADSHRVENLAGKDIYFGEVLGEHSEVSRIIEPGDISLISSDPALVAKLDEIKFSVGINPLGYDEGGK